MPFLAPVIAAIGGALAGASSFIAGLGFFGKLAIGIGLNIASAAIQKALQKKNQPQTQPTGAILQKEYGAVVPRRVLMGLVGLAGHDCYVNSWGAANGALQQMFVLSDYPCDGLNRVGINGTWTATDAGGGAFPNLGAVVSEGPFSGKIWFKFHDGTQTTANADLIARANPSGRWSSDHKGIGVCYVIATFVFDPDELNSLPDFFFEVRGARLYDWRLDSTNGGSGSHRWGWANYSTHEWSENPIVMAYSVKRGLSVGTDLFCGMDMPAGDLPVSKWTAAANICDEVTEGEDRYRCSIAVECGPDTTHGDNIEAIMLSCGGMVVNAIDGSWPLVGSDQPTVADLTDDDLVAGAPVKYREKRSMSDLVNAVSGKFADPNLLWAFDDYEPQISSAALVVDRRTRDVGVDFPMVRSKRQAGQLAAIYLEDNRYEAQATALFKPRWLVLEPGDWITWRSKTWLVTDVTIASLDEERARCAQLSLKQVDGSIYDGIANPNVIITVPPGTPSYLAEVASFALSNVSVSQASGGAMPAIAATWDAISDTTVTDVDLEFWPTAQTTVVSKTRVKRDQTYALLLPINANTQYAVRHRLVTFPGRLVAWSTPVTITTADVKSRDIETAIATLTSEMRDVLSNLRAENDSLFTRLEKLATDSGSSQLEDIVDRTRFERKIKSLSASATFETVLRVTADSAFASQLITVNARITDAEGLIAASASSLLLLEADVATLDGDVSAAAAAILAVQAKTDFGTAEGLMGWKVVSSPSGVIATWQVVGRVSVGAVTFSGGLYFRILGDGSTQLILDVAQLFVTGGGALYAPFIVDGGVVYMDEARIRNLAASNITLGGLTYDRFPANEITNVGVLNGSALFTNGAPPAAYNTWFDVPGATLTLGPSSASYWLGGFSVTCTWATSGSTKAKFRIISLQDGTTLYESAFATATTGTPQSVSYGIGPILGVNLNANAGYKMQYFVESLSLTGASVTVSASNTVLWWRR